MPPASRPTDSPDPVAEIRRLYEDAEARTAAAAEELVGSQGFGGLLGTLADCTATARPRAGATPSRSCWSSR